MVKIKINVAHIDKSRHCLLSIEMLIVSLIVCPYYVISDACHTLVCAIMLLNTDLHGQVRWWHSVHMIVKSSIFVLRLWTRLDALFAVH